MGIRAGIREKSDNWTLRTQRSAFEFLRTISKYTPARPEVKHAAVTAAKPLVGLITWKFWKSCALPTTVLFGAGALVVVCI